MGPAEQRRQPNRTLIRGGTLADGTGAPLRRADVLIEGDRIRAVDQRIDAEVDEVVDASELIVAPGFIDVHTHYDAQALWDRDLTPSSWHGVTTVLMGNCGFGIAPTRAEGRDTILHTLENVEGMSYEALVQGVPWGFETFEEYLDLVGAQPRRINVQVFVGHTPLRLFVMGSEAYDRGATPTEVEEMAALAASAVAAGAVGLSSSQGNLHFGADGRPVPSRRSSTDEFMRLVQASTWSGGVLNQVATGGDLSPDEAVRRGREVGASLVWTPIVTDALNPGAAVEKARRLSTPAERIWGQFPCRPVVMQMQLVEPYPFSSLSSFRPITGAERAGRADLYHGLLEDSDALSEVEQFWGHRWHNVFVAETDVHEELVDQSIADLARQRSVSPVELLIRLGLEEDLQTRFRVVLANDGDDEVGELLAMEEPLLGLSDAGAHADQLCDAGFTTYLLGHWVRERNAVSLEHAVWRLTGQIADATGLTDRGRLTPGFVADIVAFDPQRVGAGPLERVRDLPSGAERLVCRPIGLQAIWVGGVQTCRGGIDIADVHPGRLLRRGAREVTSERMTR